MAGSAAHSPPAMDRRLQRLATRVSIALAAAATLCLLYLFRHTSCFPAPEPLTLTLSLAPFPRTSCDAASRRVLPPDRRLAKLRSSSRWRRHSSSLSTSIFPPLRRLGLLAGSSRVLCLAAGAGNAVDALNAAGVTAVTGIDLVDFPPLVRRADPHRLPFPDGAFDLVFSDDPAGFSGALFPSRLAAEAERSVRLGGAIALAVDRQLDTSIVAALFKRSRVVDGKIDDNPPSWRDFYHSPPFVSLTCGVRTHMSVTQGGAMIKVCTNLGGFSWIPPVVDTRDVTLDGSQVRLLILQRNGTTLNPQH